VLVTNRQSSRVAAQLSHGRQRAESLSHHNREPLPPTPHALPPSRDASTIRGRALTITSNHSTSRANTPTSATPLSASKLSSGHESPGLERRPSGSYGHHRQTSIVHGIQHSRNTSFASPTSATSPISQQSIAESVSRNGLDGKMMGSKDIGQIPMLGPTMVVGTQNHSPSSSTSHANGDPSLQYGTPRRLERGHSNGGKLRAGGQPSHKTHESRTVGEYALHQLFTEFEYLADQKFAQCLNSNRPEVRTEQICGPGVDPALDQLISALGHIARQKPKPLIDTLMSEIDSCNHDNKLRLQQAYPIYQYHQSRH